jgi:hypothetical protein
LLDKLDFVSLNEEQYWPNLKKPIFSFVVINGSSFLYCWFGWNETVTSLFSLQSGPKVNGFIVLSLHNLAKLNGYIVPHVKNQRILPVCSFQVEIVWNDRFGTMKRWTECVPSTEGKHSNIYSVQSLVQPPGGNFERKTHKWQL